MAARFVIGQYTVHWLAAGNFSQHKERIMMVLLLISQTFLFPFFILTGRLSRILLECRTEITRSGKSGFLCNFREGHIRAGYQCNSFFYTELTDIFVRSHACKCFQLVIKRRTPQSYFLADKLDAQVGIIYIFLDDTIQFNQECFVCQADCTFFRCGD